MAITSQANVKSGLPGQRLRWIAPSATVRQWSSYWQLFNYPLPASNPPSIGTGGEIPTKATVGANNFRNAGAGNQLYLYLSQAASSVNTRLMIIDRLWHAGSVLGNITTSQAVSSPPALTRPDANGVDAELWLEIGGTGWGGTATVVTASYTNSAGTSGRTALCTVGASQALNQGNMFPFKLQANDLGIQSVQSVSLTPSTGTAGNAALVILRKLATVNVERLQRPEFADFFAATLAKVYNDACLSLMTFNNSSNSNNSIAVQAQLIEG